MKPPHLRLLGELPFQSDLKEPPALPPRNKRRNPQNRYEIRQRSFDHCPSVMTTALQGHSAVKPPKSNLSKRLPKWRKKPSKSQQQTLSIKETLISVRTEEYILAFPDTLQSPEDLEAGAACKETWAALWLRRLRPRKRKLKGISNAQNSEVRPKLMTLAEQLEEAQTTPLCIPDAKVHS